jgi:hypothetical protein
MVIGHRGQRLVLGAVAWGSRPLLARRRRPLPGSDSPSYLTTVLRLPDLALPPLDLPDRHHRYPAGSIHVTVANVDRGRVPLADALSALSAGPLPAVPFALAGLATSPDTVFVRCLYDEAFVALRRAVAAAFALAPLRAPAAVPHRWAAHANVVRFDGAGTWIRDDRPNGTVVADVLEVVRTDRLLSDARTEVLARLSLTT